MTVGELKAMIGELPDGTPVLVDHQDTWFEETVFSMRLVEDNKEWGYRNIRPTGTISLEKNAANVIALVLS